MFFPSGRFTPVLPPIALSTCATSVVGMCPSPIPPALLAPTNPATSPTTPPPIATSNARRSAPARTSCRQARSTVERFFPPSRSSNKIVARWTPLKTLSRRAPNCFHTRGDKIRKTARCSSRPATARADWAAAPRPHRISYVPLADRTLIFFIAFAQERLKNVTQLALPKTCDTISPKAPPAACKGYQLVSIHRYVIRYVSAIIELTELGEPRIVKTTQLGRGGPVVSVVGLGCMAMSDMYGPSDEMESIATIQEAIDSGINLLDTGDFYGMGHNEMLIRRAIEGRRKDVFIAVKFGALRGPDGAFSGQARRPVAIRNFLTYSLRRLGTDYIDLYQPCRVDPHTPIEEVVGAIANFVKSGHVRHIGLSEASASTVRRANSVHPISALQIEYSIVSRSIEAHILPAVRELGIGVTAYGVLSRG